MPTARVMMRPPQSLMAQVDAAVVEQAVAASPIAAQYAADTDPESAKELLAARMKQIEEGAGEPMEGVDDPESADERRMRPTRAPERGVDWSDVAQEGARFVRSGSPHHSAATMVILKPVETDFPRALMLARWNPSPYKPRAFWARQGRECPGSSVGRAAD